MAKGTGNKVMFEKPRESTLSNVMHVPVEKKCFFPLEMWIYDVCHIILPRKHETQRKILQNCSLSELPYTAILVERHDILYLASQKFPLINTEQNKRIQLPCYII